MLVGVAIGAFLLVGQAVPAWARPDLTLEVRVVDLPSDRGMAGVALWNAPAGFPEGVEHALAKTYVPIHRGVAVVTFDHLPPGVYAVSVYHDENGNRKLDKSWVGVPKEAWGVSNDVHPRLRAPRFDEASVRLADGQQTIVIHVR